MVKEVLRRVLWRSTSATKRFKYFVIDKERIPLIVNIRHNVEYVSNISDILTIDKFLILYQNVRSIYTKRMY